MPLEFANNVIYTVKSGDTLFGIAAQHEVTVDQLLAANAGLIDDPALIQIGLEILIPGELSGPRREPPPSGDGVRVYTIESGDTLGALAARWDCSVGAIAELNGIANPSLIFPGQRIRRPGGEIAPVADVSAAAITDPPPIVEPSSPEPVLEASTSLLGARETRLTFTRWPLDMPPAILTGGFRQDYGGYLHRGIDLGGVPVGTPIFAPAGGTLAVHIPGDGWGDGSFGICVVIDHPGTPWYSIYAHMSATSRTTGEVAQAGEQIGEIGFTGRVVPPGPAGAHTHWQLSTHSGFPTGFEYIGNPLDFLELP
jgi:murein DD-endopeptidase MepM/ murein hydrolase activator NlpD